MLTTGDWHIYKNRHNATIKLQQQLQAHRFRPIGPMCLDHEATAGSLRRSGEPEASTAAHAKLVQKRNAGGSSGLPEHCFTDMMPGSCAALPDVKLCSAKRSISTTSRVRTGVLVFISRQILRLCKSVPCPGAMGWRRRQPALAAQYGSPPRRR